MVALQTPNTNAFLTRVVRYSQWHICYCNFFVVKDTHASHARVCDAMAQPRREKKARRAGTARKKIPLNSFKIYSEQFQPKFEIAFSFIQRIPFKNESD